MRSIPSTRENTLDALDELDVVTGVVAIRDQGAPDTVAQGQLTRRDKVSR